MGLEHTTSEDLAYIVQEEAFRITRADMPAWFCSIKDSRGLYHHGYGDTEAQATENAKNQFYDTYNAV